MLRGVDGLRAQEPAKQERFKLNFYLSFYLDHSGVKASIAERLQPRRIQAKLIYIVDELRGIDFLDLLPTGASKFRAIVFLRKRLGLSFDACLFAGESGNDLAVPVSPILAVLIANGSEAVRQEALSGAMRASKTDRLYCARGGRDSLNGNYASCVLDGIAHFHPDQRI